MKSLMTGSIVFGLLMLAALAAQAAGPNSAQQGRSTNTSYCCTDAQGRHLCAEILPLQCYGRPYREIDSTGLIKYHDAPPTAEQRAQKEAQLAAKREQEKRLMEQRRKDIALLNTYSSDKEIDVIRDSKLKEIEAGIKTIEAKRVDLRAEQKKLASESEFYKNKPVPRELQEAARNLDAELKAQQTALDAKAGEMRTVRAKYAEEKRRYLELTRESGRMTPTSRLNP